MSFEKQCGYVRPEGTACKGFHQQGSAFCFVHDPGKAQERAAAVRKGGLAPKRKPQAIPHVELPAVSLPPLPLKTLRDVERALARVIQLVYEGRMPASTGTVLFKTLTALLNSKKEHQRWFPQGRLV